jgi:hypothetical protein
MAAPKVDASPPTRSGQATLDALVVVLQSHLKRSSNQRGIARDPLLARHSRGLKTASLRTLGLLSTRSKMMINTTITMAPIIRLTGLFTLPPPFYVPFLRFVKVWSIHREQSLTGND